MDTGAAAGTGAVIGGGNGGLGGKRGGGGGHRETPSQHLWDPWLASKGLS